MATSTRKSITDMAADAAEAWANEVEERDRRRPSLADQLSFAVGYLRGFKAGQTAKPVGGKR